MSAPAESAFGIILRSMGEENGIALVITAFFDESAENDSQNGLLTVSGYALDLDGMNGLTSEWKNLLAKETPNNIGLGDGLGGRGIV